MIGMINAAARNEPECERMIARDRAEPARRGGDRNLQPLGERNEIGGSASIAHALPDQDHRPLGLKLKASGQNS